jgi:O-antigen biosynthesis protein
LNPGNTNRPYSKRQIRRGWRLFRFWVYRFTDQKLRAALSLVLSDETFGRLAKLLKKPVHTGSSGPRTPLIKPVALSEVADIDGLVTIVALPPRVGSEDLALLESALNDSSTPWTFVATQGVDPEVIRFAAGIALTRSADFDLLYTDEHYISEDFPRARPAALGPHTLLSGNAVGRHYLLRNSTARAVGGVRKELASACEFDLFLRMRDEGARFSRYPSLIETAKPSIDSSDLIAATGAALARRSLSSLKSEGPTPEIVNWQVYSLEPVRVEILIPTRDRLDLLQRCIEQIEKVTTYSHYSITILNNDSIEPETLEFLKSTSHKVVNCPGEFNYARIINQGAAQSNAEFLVMLNNDTFVKTSNWLELLLGAALLDDVGVVGAKIVNQNGDVEHSGIAIAPYPQHIRHGVNVPANWSDFAGIRNVAAVTGALHMISRVKWIELGGMDEDLKVLLNDVDLCLRAELKGWHTVLQPTVVIQHFISSSRGRLNPKSDRERFIAQWELFLNYQDQYFPEACSLYGNQLTYNYPTSQLLRWSAVFKSFFALV